MPLQSERALKCVSHLARSRNAGDQEWLKLPTRQHDASPSLLFRFHLADANIPGHDQTTTGFGSQHRPDAMCCNALVQRCYGQRNAFARVAGDLRRQRRRIAAATMQFINMKVGHIDTFG